jgi:HlyD family secretion protein
MNPILPRLRGLLLLVAAIACSETKPADAYGNFEADEVVVAAETSGPLEQFAVVEGGTLAAGQVVGLVDTTQLAFERDQLRAQRRALVAQRAEASDQRHVLDVQHEIAQRSRERIERLFEKQAATATQRDQTERDERVLALQAQSVQSTLDRVSATIASVDAGLAAVEDRLRRASVRNPVAGTVLARYVLAGELIQPGQPLYRIANLDTLTLRVYFTESQLGTIRLGQTVDVHVDDATGGMRTLGGLVTWVSARAEFTPTPVQTREDRTDLVYAAKVRVANPDGALKIGMPGDVTLSRATVAVAPPAGTP